MFRTPTSLSATAVSQLAVYLLDSAKSDRRECKGRIGGRTSRKNARSRDEEILMIVTTSPPVDHRICRILSHDAGAHDVCRGVPVESAVWLYWRFGLRQSRVHQLKNRLRHFESRRHTTLGVVVDTKGNQRSRQLQFIVHLAGNLNAILTARQHFSGKAQPDHPRNLVTCLFE